MDELLRQLMTHLRAMWAYRWWGLALAWVIGAVGAVVIYMLPDKYEASARIYVDTQSVLAPLMAGLAVPTDVNQQVNMLTKTLVSRPNVEKLIRMADLDLAVRTPVEREALIADVTKRVRIQGTGRDNLYTLSFMDGQADRAKRVVQSLVSIFVESGLGDKRKDTDSARRFIEEQIKNYEQKLDEAETRLKDFRLKNLALLGESGKDSLAQIGEVTVALRQSRLQLREAENSRDALKRQLVGEEPVLLPENASPSTSGISIPELDGRIEALKKSLDELLRSYTELHPDVVGTRKVLASLEAQRAEEVKARRKPGSSTISTQTNPVYQQMKLSLAESEAAVASLQTRVAEYDARLAQIQQMVKLGPQIEQEFAQLNRDYEVHKRNYETLVSRRESANLSVEMQATSGVAEFRLVDPPSVPSKPSAPNRMLLLPAVGILALILGAGLCFLISQVRPSFHDSRSLRETTGLPILGSISLNRTPDRKRADLRKKYAFLGAVATYIGAFGAVMGLAAWMGRA
ncbi:XrtA system polysaccharide chain length determinant [Uliginosibacterium sp. H1]|uniref:XrtA system polysaccharide chain length determinant n=1 Tax=Uliginosibacterium sp. H1 TaxID=3114757 RepID=UPI002E19CF30|nr:XrtA system polysaccharide chain length determinant [Uliginosibacterium sp. H1]